MNKIWINVVVVVVAAAAAATAAAAAAAAVGVVVVVVVVVCVSVDVGPRIAEARTTRSYRSVGWWPRRSHHMTFFLLLEIMLILCFVLNYFLLLFLSHLFCV